MTTPDGPHLAFPFRIGTDGRTVTVSSLEAHIRDEVMQLVLTTPGERVFLPDFGGGARRLVFEAVGQRTEAMAKAMLSDSLTRYMGHRITVEELLVDTYESTIRIDLKYRIAGTAESRQLRFERTGG
jgi:phage baseplate assembly protein W